MNSIEGNNDKGEEELSLCLVLSQIVILLFVQAALSVMFCEQHLLLVETHSNRVEQKCLMSARGVMEVFVGVLINIHIEKLSAEAVSQRDHMIFTPATNALSHMPEAMDADLDNATYVNEEWVGKINVRSSARTKTCISP